jgi:hypothetical protein
MKRNKVLCFTTSYGRPYHLYHTLNSIVNQTYKYFDYSIGICIDNDQEKEDYLSLLSDFIQDSRIRLFFHSNLDQHNNYLYPIRNMDYGTYDIFVKIDDDDIYTKNYLTKNLKSYKELNVDIISSNIIYEINNNKLYKGKFDNVGGYWHEDLESSVKFGMPFSYIFNRKCLETLLNTTREELEKIHPFEDPGWRRKWRQDGIASEVIEDSDLAVYHIHGKNISSSGYLVQDDKYSHYEDSVFTLCLFKHKFWESYIVINKLLNRVYNIKNNDCGEYITINQDSISILWDKYSEKEKFIRRNIDKTFIYEHIT